MIRRYLSTETTLTHNKYVLSPFRTEILEEANGMFELEMELPKGVEVNKRDIITAPTPRGEQPFRVYRITKSLTGKKIYARHKFYDLADALLIDTRPTNATVNDALQSIFNVIGWAGWSYYSDITDRRTAYYIRKNPVEAIIGAENSVLNLWGGNLIRNGKEVRINASGIDRGYEIRLGKNLLGIEDDSDDTNVITRLYPTYEKDKIIYGIPEKYVDSPLIGSYPTPIEKEVRVALTDDQKGYTDEQIYQALRDYCNNLYSVDNIDKPIANYKVDFVELSKTERYKDLAILETIDLYDLVKINVIELGIDLKARVIKYRYDAIKERYISLELGGFKSTNQYQIDNIVKKLQNDKAKASAEYAELYDMAINKVTGNKGGYKITRLNANDEPYETLYMDTPDINTATKVLRCNQNGIAGSNSGFNGPYNVAITTDGWVVAERILANQLSAISADLGTITAGRIQDVDNESFWDLDNKIIKLNVDELKIQNVSAAKSTDLELLDDSLNLKFSKQGGKNLVANSGFQDGTNGWALSGGAIALGDTTSSPSGKRLRLSGALNTTQLATQTISKGFDPNNKKWTLSSLMMNTHTTRGTTNPFVDVQLTITYTDASKEYFGLTGNDLSIYDWAKKTKVITSNAAKTVASFTIGIYVRDVTGNYLDVGYVRLEEGEVVNAWSNADNESFATSYKLDGVGFEMKDSNGGVLIEVAKGIANEQNFGSTQNVESGYPLNMSFEIGDTTSLITSVKLKLKQYNFRTDSKGAASGGGSTSGPSSKSTTDGRWDSDTTLIPVSSEYTPAVGVYHLHYISKDKLAHNHGMAHTHSTPSHSHGVDFGILETTNTNGTIDVYIDGVYRVQTTNTDITLDITPWVTTNGVHSLELRSPNLKRIQADVFIKSYIRR